MTSPIAPCLSSDISNLSSSPSEGALIVRIRRTLRLGGRNSTTSSRPPPPPTPPPEHSNFTNHNRSRSTSSFWRNKTRLTAFERFVNVVRRKKDGQVVFPPADWFPPTQTVDVQSEAIQGTSTPNPDLDHPTAVPLPLSPASPELSAEEHQLGDVGNPDQFLAEGGETPPEPTFLARKIQTLLSAFPLLSTSVPATPSDSGSGPALVPSNLNSDWKFVSFLSSPSVMNGSIARGRQSVWSVLDMLRGTPTEPSQPGGSATEKGKERATEEQSDENVPENDHSSIMLCGPLLPTPESEVEFARSEIISVQEDEEAPTPRDRTENEMKPTSAGKEERIHVTKGSEKLIWLPSTTKISLEVMWWGYRVYLPPPVLALLDNQHIEASKQAALLTAALKWILDRVPSIAVPLQMRPAFKLLAHLVPYLVYIGSFVAWSWAAIKGFDKGNGVILTATWLLPVALIPGTWGNPETMSAAPADTAVCA